MGALFPLTVPAPGFSAGQEADKLRLIASMNPGSTPAQLKEQLKSVAKQDNMKYSVVLNSVYKEAAGARLPYVAARPTASGGGGANEKVSFPRAARAGDVFVHSSVTRKFDHGHAGLYVTRRKFAEAPGGTSASRIISIKKRGRTAPKGKTLIYRVGESTYRRAAAIAQTKKYYLDKPYDSNFLRNRKNGSSKLNCSELVWRAFKYHADKDRRIELDRDDGVKDLNWAVYPRDLQDSGWTHWYKTV